MYLCVCKDNCHCGCALIYSTINGVTAAALLHSGCRYNLQEGAAKAAHFSAQAKSDLLKTTTFSSLAYGMFSVNGYLNFLGESVIQSQVPERGDEPEVSICV